MSRQFGVISNEVIAIRKTLEYTKKKIKETKFSGTAYKNKMILFFLSQFPFVIRTVANDNLVIKTIELIEQLYISQLIFTARLPIQLLIHRIVQYKVPDYSPYSSRLLDTSINYARFDSTWQKLLEQIMNIDTALKNAANSGLDSDDE